MNYSIVIDDLFQSYTKQVHYYKELRALVQKIIGQLAVSRGDLAPLMGLFAQKKKIVEGIEIERERVKGPAALWQEYKGNNTSLKEAEQLDKVLAETEQAIKLFLESEDQLQIYLEHAMVEKRNLQ